MFEAININTKKPSLHRELFNSALIRIESTKNYKKPGCEPFDLSASADDLTTELVARYLQGDFIDLMNLRYAIIKSYIPKETINSLEDVPEVFLSPIRGSTVGLSASVKLINKFFIENITKELAVKDEMQIKEKLADFVVDKLLNLVGNVVYVKHFDADNKTRIRYFNTALKKAGFVKSSILPDFYIKQEKAEVCIKSNMQQFLLKSYLEIYNRYVVNINNLVQDKTILQFKNTCQIFLSYLDNLEERMDQNTKQNPDFIAANKKVKNFKEDWYFGTYLAVSYGELYFKVEKALDRLKSNKATEADKKVLADFYDKVEYLNAALKVQADGKTHPANYFACMPVQLGRIEILLNKFAMYGNLPSEKRKVVYNTKDAIALAFPSKLHRTYANNYTTFETKVDAFKNITKRDISTGEIIMSTVGEKDWQLFKKTVYSIFDKYKLPRYEACVNCVCNSLLDLKTPIVLPEKNINKENTASK